MIVVFLYNLDTCKKCEGQYVGKSETKFKLRHSNHKQEIKEGGRGAGPALWSKGEMQLF